LERVKEILLNPLAAITKAKKERNLNKTILIMIFSWFIIAVSFLFSYNSEFMIIKISSSIAIFLFGILFSIFFSYILNIVMKILGGKGKYYEALTATTYSSLPVSFGFLIMSIAYAIHPMIGMIIGFIIFAITTASSLSIYFRAIKEFYSTDIFVNFIGILIVIYSLIISMYISTFFSISFPLFGNLRIF